jgi:hypothetical protein
MQKVGTITTIVALILAVAATRLLPHPPNFTAVSAMCLFGGAYFHRRWLAFVVPFAALLLSDAVLTAIYGQSITAAVSSVWGNYVAFALIVLLGTLLYNRVTLGRTASATILATALFFLLTNFKVWLMGHGTVFPHTPAGLVACYVAALPFARNDLLGNAFYVSILFGSMELLKRRWPALLQNPEAVPVRA